VRENGKQYGIDTSTLLVAGSSAGGHLAALAELTPNDPAFQPGFERADTSITGAITLYGPVIYAELPGAQHAFDLFHSMRFEQVIDGIEAFAASVISTRSQVGARGRQGLARRPQSRT
jgi:acetyl esterase/lipase